MMFRIAVLILALGLACKGGSGQEGEPPAEPDQPTLGETEAQRGREACEAYKQIVCACAGAAGAADPEMARECRLADARIEALDLQLRVLAAGDDLKNTDRGVVMAEVRKVITGCFEDSLAVDSRCPPAEPSSTE